MFYKNTKVFIQYKSHPTEDGEDGSLAAEISIDILKIVVVKIFHICNV